MWLSLQKNGCANTLYIFWLITKVTPQLYSRELKPRIIIEYKAPHIAITQKVFDQITVYNMLLHVDYLIVSNGLQHYCCKMDYNYQKYLYLEDIPNYQEIQQIWLEINL